MIFAGSASDVRWGNGNWIFLDVGFSSTKTSCGLLIGDGEPKCLTFSDAKKSIHEEVDKSTSLNLVIEAPLSVCFDPRGNPKHRKIELQDGSRRYWYYGSGPAVMIASMYILREIWEKETRICLFEGFVSYKAQGPSDHSKDVLDLRDVVRDPLKSHDSIHGPDTLKEEHDQLFSAFRVAGLDFGVPAVIRPPQLLAK
jgi:hypothetical protein